MTNFIRLTLASAIICFIFACKGDTAQKAGAAKEVSNTTGKSISLDTNRSNILWTGSKPTGSHTGTIKFVEGFIKVDGSKVTGGEFTIDMNTITSTDLNGDSRKSLEAHLKGTAEGKSDHFFNVNKYPTSTFEITSIKNLENNDYATHLVYGNLTMKGITKSVSFQAAISDRGTDFAVRSSEFNINRTDWGINFKSKTVLDDLKDGFINDEIKLQINVIAPKSR